MINQNGLSDVKFNAKFLFVFLQESLFLSSLKKKGESSPFGNFIAISRKIT